MTTTALTSRPAGKPLVYDHPDLSLMLSVGEPPRQGKNYPSRLPCFRAKPGRDDRWAGAAAAFNEKYGVTFNEDGSMRSGPAVVPIHFASNRLEDVFDIRYLAFGQDRLAARGDTNYATCPQQYLEPEWVTSFPLEGDPQRFQISGPTDPLCLGGEYGIPEILEKGRPSGKPALDIVSTLYFSLAEVGSFTATCAISTKSVRSRSNLMRALKMIESTGSLTHWLMLLTVKQTQIRYRDADGKSHTSLAPILSLVGPIRNLDDRSPISLPEALAEMDKAYARGLAISAPRHVAPAELPAADGRWANLEPVEEEVTGEVVITTEGSDGDE